MNAMVREYLRAHPNTLVSYVRDSKGFVKGVVVSVGKDQIGWSLVNGNRDSDWVYRKTHQLPAYQKLEKELRSLENLSDLIQDEKVRDKIHKTVLSANSLHSGLSGMNIEVKVPLFERGVGVFHAISRALESPVVFDVADDGADLIIGTPNDNDLNHAIFKMRDRSRKYYRS